MEPDKTENWVRIYFTGENSEGAKKHSVLAVPRRRARDHWQYRGRSIGDCH